MILNLLTRLFNALKTAASNHKKKLIALAILVLGYKIIRRKIKTQTIISIAMFFIKFWSKVLDYLPIPNDPGYRMIEPFQYMPTSQINELGSIIDIKQLLLKIKRKQEGAYNQLKLSVLSAVLVNIVLYKVHSIYDVICRKYKNDFMELGAGAQFEKCIQLLKRDFIDNLNNFRIFVANQISELVQDIPLQDVFNVTQVQEMFKNLVNQIFKDTVDISSKVLSRKTHYEQTKQFKLAQNCFKSTKCYVQQKKSSKLSSIFKIITYPARLTYRAISNIMKQPVSQLSSQRFATNQFLYILPLKRLQVKINWPTMSSQHLFNLVMQELINFFYSINFNIVSYRHALLQLSVFSNRLSIYFQKKVAGDKKEKKFMDLLIVFYKIVQEQLVIGKGKAQFYERELLAAFRDTRYRLSSETTPIKQYKLRNKILSEIYYKNELQHLQKDMQAKLYNQRDKITIEPVAKVSRVYEEKDEIQQLMQIYNRADEQRPTTRAQMQMMRQLTQS